MYIAPMIPVKREEAFDDGRYIFEPKIDGRRLILSMENGVVRLYTRHGYEVTAQYPELRLVPIEDGSDVVLDGEVACLDADNGTIDSDSVVDRFLLRKPMEIQAAANRQPAHFFVFDILKYKGTDLRGLPLELRRQLLERVLSGNRYMSPLMCVEEAGTSLFEAVRQKKLEGIVAKKKTSKYEEGPNSNWQSVISYRYAVAEIVGYRKNQFGWLLRHQGRTVGILENDVPEPYRKAFYSVTRTIATDEDRDFVYMQPLMKAKVRFRNWTRSGLLRAPEFVDFVV